MLCTVGGRCLNDWERHGREIEIRTVSDRVKEDGLVRSSLTRACLAVSSVRCRPFIVHGGGDRTWTEGENVLNNIRWSRDEECSA